ICSGIWPPSNAAETCLRAPVPLVPRPAVLPLDASPRPTRVLALFEPFAGRRSWSLIGSLICYLLPRHFFDDDQVTYSLDHAANLRGVGTDHRVADTLQTEGTKIFAMLWLGADSAFDLGNLQRHFLRLLTCASAQNTCRSDLFVGLDRKSTRLNSSHVKILYAVFCL